MLKKAILIAAGFSLLLLYAQNKVIPNPVGPKLQLINSGAAGATGPSGAAGATGATGPSGPTGGAPFSCALAAVSSITCTHNLGTSQPWVACYDNTGLELGSTGSAANVTAVNATSANAVALTFSASVTGTCLISTGSVGPQGAAGAAGATGATGPAGAAGATGATGIVNGHNVTAVLTCPTTSASGTAEVCNTTPTFTPVAGDTIVFQADIANTGAFTLNVNSLGAKSVTKRGTIALIAGDIAASPFQTLMTYDGTNWEMHNGANPVAYTNVANTFTAAQTVSQNGALSAPAFTGTGTWITGGTSTTTKPYALIEPSGTTSTGWSTNGTGLGVNAANGFTGRLIDLQINGTTALFYSSSAGLRIASDFSTTAGTGAFYWTTQSIIKSPADGVNTITNNAANGYTRLTLGPDTSSNPSLCPSGTTMRHMQGGACTTFAPTQAAALISGGSISSISGCSTSANAGNTFGTYTSGTTGTCTVVLTFATTAPTGWSCFANDRITVADLQSQTASTTTTATISGTTVSGDVINYGCVAY